MPVFTARVALSTATAVKGAALFFTIITTKNSIHTNAT